MHLLPLFSPQRLAKEVRIWAKLNHLNVLPLLGFFTEGDNVMPALVSEWMEKGSLRSCLDSLSDSAKFAVVSISNGLHCDEPLPLNPLFLELGDREGPAILARARFRPWGLESCE